MTRSSWLFVALTCALAWALSANIDISEAVQRAQNAESRADSILVARDSLRAVAVHERLISDSLAAELQLLSAEWEERRDSLESEVEEHSSHHNALADSIAERVDSVSAEMAKELVVAHENALSAEREKSQSLQDENNLLRVANSSLLAERETLLQIIKADSAVISEQFVAIEEYRRLADPPFWKKFVGSTPKVLVGVAVGVVAVSVIR